MSYMEATRRRVSLHNRTWPAFATGAGHVIQLARNTWGTAARCVTMALENRERKSSVCRLFGMNAGRRTVRAEYWLADAPDSMLEQSRRNPDGSGIGWYEADGKPRVDKQSAAAYADPEFERTASRVTATTLVTHVRFATVGAHTVANTHPFRMRGRLMAHNGGFGDLDRVDQQLGPYRDLVLGQTDSERFAALICQQTDVHDGDVASGMVHAAKWLARNVPVSSLNCVVVSPGRMWALRYPDCRSLHVATRSVCDGSREPGWSGRSRLAEHRIMGDPDGESTRVALVASERIDGRDDWRQLDPGELLYIDEDLRVESHKAVEGPPEFPQPAGNSDPNDDSD
ncbi:MAG: class II glutamine amidotransferase [Candidatus Nanopelagicales bacterium]|nr:class II glutamine amidotransferase [Candidatus Nanopelagicales bacterium]